MSKITHQNIEQWLFDHAEGNLTPSQTRELNNFLEIHPEYQLDLDSWDDANLREEEEEESINYIYTAQLLAIAGGAVYTRYYIAAGFALLLGGGGLWYALSGSTSSNNPDLANQTTLAFDKEFIFTGETPQLASNESQNLNYASVAHSTQSSVQSNPLATTNSNSQVNSTYQSVSANVTPTNNQNTLIHTVNTTNNSNIINTTNNAEIVVNKSPVIPYQFYVKEPELNFEESGMNMAKLAFENKAALDNKTPEKELIVSNNHTDEQIEKEKNHDKNGHQKRKHFSDRDLGIHNFKDHILLIPGNLPIAEYPSFAGAAVSPTLSLNYRNQWTLQSQTSQKASFIYDQYNKKLKSAWGLGVQAGTFADGHYSNLGVNFYFSPKIRLNKQVTLEPGVALSYQQNSLVGNALSHNNSFEPYQGTIARPAANAGNLNGQNTSGFDVNASMLLNTKTFYILAGVNNILRPTQPYYTGENAKQHAMQMRYKTTLGTDFKRFHDSKWSFSPQVSFIHQGEINSIWLGSNVNYDQLMIGASVAQNGQFLTSIGINTGILKINYNFDLTRSYLTESYLASHEISARFTLGGLAKKKTAILDQEK